MDKAQRDGQRQHDAGKAERARSTAAGSGCLRDFLHRQTRSVTHRTQPRSLRIEDGACRMKPVPRQPKPSTHSEERPSRLLRIWLRDVLFSIILAMLIVTFLYQPVRVEGTSMAPELQDRDRVFINKLVYRLGDVHRQDVVIFHYPNDPEKTYIKRVIAGPGDTIRIQKGAVYLNGELLQEPYIASSYEDHRSLPLTTIPPDEYFVMGDHRNISSDSRDFGPVARSFIYGKALFVYWPTNQAGWVH